MCTWQPLVFMARIRFFTLWSRRPLVGKLVIGAVAVALLLGVLMLLLRDYLDDHPGTPVPHPGRRDDRGVWHTPPPDKPVTDAAFHKCVARWLDTSSVPANTVIPFVILPLTLEWADFRLFMCRVHAHASYLYVVQNGDVEELTQVLRKLREAVPSPRLIIEHRPTNIGYAGAVNEGYRVALAKSVDEVPFVGVFNCDVYFEKKFFKAFLPDVYKMLTPDAARIASLEAEVQAEAAAAALTHTPTLRAAAANITGLSLSYLLPDRVRYGSFAEQRKAFEQHVGMFHFNYQSMSAFLVSRLALLAGGFLDENCYPAYFEDYDWRFRMTNLGFRTVIGTLERYGRFFHSRGGNIRVIGDGTAKRSLSYELEATRVGRMIAAKPGVDYGEVKWAWHREAHIQTSLDPFPEMDFVVPVDVWVLDPVRRKRTVDIGLGVWPAVEMRNTYNRSVLEVLRPFSRIPR